MENEEAENANNSSTNSRACLYTLIALAQVLGLTIVILIGVWLGDYLHGFAWDYSGREFNIHPLCMALSLLYLSGTSALVYRGFPNVEKLHVKIIHATLNGLAIVGVIIGLVAVFQFHNAYKIKNLYSLHSWCGIVTVSLFFLQYLGGFLSFLYPRLPEDTRSTLLPYHRFLGSAILIFAGITAVSGINEKLFFTLPGKLYQNLPPPALLGNFAGLCIIAYVILIIYVLQRRDWKRVDFNEGERLPLTPR